jgi:hypothetical protein
LDAVRSLPGPLEPATSQSADTSEACPSDTWWDGYTCKHPLATCGGWDGLSCAASDDVEALDREFRKVDVEVEGICADSDRLANPGTVSDAVAILEHTVSRAVDLEQYIARVASYRPTPRRVIVADIRAGNMYHCIWSRLRAFHVPPSFAPGPLGALPQPSAAAGPGAAATKPSAGGPVRSKWLETRWKYLGFLEVKFVQMYVNGIWFARRYAIEKSSLAPALHHLSLLAYTIGDDEMRDLFRKVIDPADPTEGDQPRRSAVYIPGMFDLPP